MLSLSVFGRNVMATCPPLDISPHIAFFRTKPNSQIGLS